ncbi:MAG: flagellar protein FlaG [Burkholderiaceae bacterium]|nr:flagellar protein FlaG [Burkholderiaceae bacterium]
MVSAITSGSQVPISPVAHKPAAPVAAPAAVETDLRANAAHASNAPALAATTQNTAKPALTPPKKPEQLRDMEQMRKNLQEAIERINEMMRDGGRELHFSINDELDRSIIIVRNQETGEVIRQIPADVVLKVAQSIEDLKGMLHNEAV